MSNFGFGCGLKSAFGGDVMFRKYVLPVLAAVGFVFALWMALQAAKPIPPSKPVAEPPRPPYQKKISGSGIVEASTRNIAVGTPVSGVVNRMHASLGQRVKAGDPLFSLDDRKERAALALRETVLREAHAKLERLLQLPRREELPVARSRVKEAEANLEDLKMQLRNAEKVTVGVAISVEELNRRRYAVQAGEARLAQAKYNLELLESGAWKPDIALVKAEIAKAEAEVNAAAVEIDRLTIRAPLDGNVLQVNIRPGEYAQGGILPQPLILMGELERLHVRVDIDENDAWRFHPDSSAYAFVRGNPEFKTALKFEYVEPYVVPKRSLTGDSNERVDTRVMQALYSFSRADLPVFAGQLMDVYIEDRTDHPEKSSALEPPGKKK
jgi:multidrug resistance efflux pump